MKKLVSVILALAMLISLMSISATAEGGKTVVSIWTDSRNDFDYMTQKVAEFNASHDKIEIDYQVMSDNYYQTLELSFDTGTAPDIYSSGQNTWNLAAAGKAIALNDYLTDELKAYFGGASAFVEGVNMQDGKILTVPRTTAGARLVYNKDILDAAGVEKVPETFDELVAAAKQITEKLSGQGIYGFAMNLKSPSSALSRTMDYLGTYLDGIWQGYDFKTGQYDFTKYTRMAGYFRKIFEDHSEFPGCDQLDIDPLRTQFAAGHIGLYISYNSAEAGVYSSQFPTDANWDYAPLPVYSKDEPVYSERADAGRSHFVSSSTQHPDEAFEVLLWLSSPEVLNDWYTAGYGLVTLSEVIESATPPEAIAKHPYMAPQETDKIWPPAPTGLALEGENYYTVFASYILGIPGYEDIEALAQDLNTRYNSALEKGRADGTVVSYTYPNFNPSDPGSSLN